MEKSKKIRLKRRKALIRRIRILCLILIIVGVGIFCLKAPIFNIKYISINASDSIDKEQMINDVKYLKGKNIFLIKEGDLQPVIESNNYIDDIKIKRQGVSKINLIVEEPVITYYYQVNGASYILNEEFVVLEVRQEDVGKSLIELRCSNLSHKNKDEDIDITDIEKDVLSEFIPYFNEIKNIRKVNFIDISNLSNIIINIDGFDIYMGDIENIGNKLNIALNILDDDTLDFKAGYINVSVESSPVIGKEEIEGNDENNNTNLNNEVENSNQINTN